MGLAEADDHIRATLVPAVAFAEHGDGLADAGGGAKVDPQSSACHGPILACL